MNHDKVAEALIIYEALNHCAEDRGCPKCPAHEVCKGDVNVLLGSAADALAEMIYEVKCVEAATPRWISIEERLPESFRPVIVCRNYAKGERKIEQGMLTVNGWWKVYGTNTKSVTHWMPLPEPPKEQT